MFHQAKGIINWTSYIFFCFTEYKFLKFSSYFFFLPCESTLTLTDAKSYHNIDLGIKGKPATIWGPRWSLRLTITLLDEPATAVGIPRDNALTVQLFTRPPPFQLLCISFSEKKGCSDSESIGGSLESLSSPGELMPVLVSPACPFHRDLHDNDACLGFSSYLSLLGGNDFLQLTRRGGSLNLHLH